MIPLTLYNPPQPSELYRGQWGFRLVRGSSTTITLQQVGPHSFVADGFPLLDATSAAALTLTIAAQYSIDDTGTFTGITPDADELHGVYYCLVGDMAGQLALGPTPPVLVDGLYRLKASGDGLLALFLGWCRTGGSLGSPEVVDLPSRRLLVNWLNRRPTSLLAQPAYADGGTATTFARTLAVWGALNAGTGDQVQYVSNGIDPADVTLQATLGAAAPANAVGLGIGATSATQPSTSTWFRASAPDRSSTSCRLVTVQAAGYATLDALAMTGGSAATFLADAARTGAAADPSATQLAGIVWA
jgi:hypothetical protein